MLCNLKKKYRTDLTNMPEAQSTLSFGETEAYLIKLTSILTLICKYLGVASCMLAPLYLRIRSRCALKDFFFVDLADWIGSRFPNGKGDYFCLSACATIGSCERCGRKNFYCCRREKVSSYPARVVRRAFRKLQEIASFCPAVCSESRARWWASDVPERRGQLNA